MSVQARWRTAPWWGLSIVAGVGFAVCTTLFEYIGQDESLVYALGRGLFFGAFFGVFIGPFAARQRLAEARAAGGLRDLDAPAVYRAVGRGTAPDDAEVRRAAAGIARHRLDQAQRWGRRSALMWSFLLALAAYLAVTSSLWWLLPAVAVAGILGWQLWTPRHLRHRLAVLRPPAHADDAAPRGT